MLAFMIFMPPKKQSENNLLVCEECRGDGTLGAFKCKACKGRGAGVFTDNYFLYWGGAKSVEDVVAQRGKRIINKIIDSFLILFGVFGFLNLFYYLYVSYALTNGPSEFSNYISGPSNLIRAAWWITPDSHLLVFFTGLLAFLYFAARSTQVAHKYEKAVGLGFGKILKILPAASFGDIGKLKQIDIARSFSLGAERTLEAAFLSARKKKRLIGADDLFLALLKRSKIKIIFGRLGVNIKSIEEKVARNIAEGQEKNIMLTPQALEILFNAYVEAAVRGSRKVEVNLILLEAVEASDFLREVLYDLNIDLKKLENVVKWIEIQDKLYERYLEFRKASVLRPKGSVNRAMTALQTPALDRVSEDLTWLAKRGMIDFCIGRDETIESILRIIEGGGRGVVLVGEHGVGKTAILERVAELMIKEDVPKILQDKRLVSVSLSEIMGGATSEEAGKRIMGAIEDAMRAGNIVLDISNLEYFAAEGAVPLAALLAEVLARYRLPVLASTTPEGYRKVVEGTALAGIFERVDVDEPEENLAIQILEAEAGGIEFKSQVYFSYDAIAGAVKLSEKYLHDRYLPDKAREIMKEAAMYVQGKRGKNSIITYEDIAKVVSEKGKVPVTSITESEKEKLLKLEEVIHERIIGQAEAVDMVSAALRRVGAGMHEGKRPIANFLFLGPTGVGKTELAKTIAEVFFGGEAAMIRVDMSEYQEKQSIYRMIGESGGEGILTEEVRRKPFALLLLDEIEKAHPDILNLFLQVMDDGRLTDGKGRTVDFTNLIIVATSNAGSDFIAKEVDKRTPIEDIKNKLLEEKLGAYFKPEFLNRFDGVIVFRPLAPEEIIKIAELLIKKIAKKLSDKGVELVVEDGALRELAKLGFDPKFGARPLRRVLAKEVEDRLANMILQGKVKRRDGVIFHSLVDIEIVPARKI